MSDYETIDATHAEVYTYIPYTDKPEVRKYTIPIEDLPEKMDRIQNPQVAEFIVDIELVMSPKE